MNDCESFYEKLEKKSRNVKNLFFGVICLADARLPKKRQVRLEFTGVTIDFETKK